MYKYQQKNNRNAEQQCFERCGGKSYSFLWCRGQAVMISTVFFMVISVIVILGVAIPVSKQIKIAGDLHKSRISFYVAEAGIDDAVFRVARGFDVGSEEFNFASSTGEITVTDTANGKLITVESGFQSYIRKISTELIFGEGSSFNYGIQTGRGGFEIRNATVRGNIFGNGNLIGTHSGATATGSAVAANQPSDVPVAANDSPFPPSQEKRIIFGAQDNIQDVAQSFTLPSGGVLSKIEVYIKDVGYPSNLTARIVENEVDFNRPSSTTTAQSVLRSSWVTNQYGWIELYFPSDTNLESSKKYWIVLDGSTNSEAYYHWANNDNSYSNEKPMLGKFGDTWQNTGDKDGYFKIYMEGTKSYIDNLNIGNYTGEEAYAYEVNDSTIKGDLYCQIGNGNDGTSGSATCNNSRNDPDPQPFPISDGNINKWKTDAEAEGVIEGDYVASSTSQLGPVKINGNLSFSSNNIALTLNGTLWVTGNITIPNGTIIRLSPSYGSNSGLIIADGIIDINNGTKFFGSGNESSYIMLLTTSNCSGGDDCNGNNAITIDNVAKSVILNAQKGAIIFKNNSGAKEATANKIIMDNNSTVEYESGLTNVNFVSGPSGGFEIKSWREVE